MRREAAGGPWAVSAQAQTAPGIVPVFICFSFVEIFISLNCVYTLSVVLQGNLVM